VLQGREPVRAVAAGTGISGRTVRKWVQRFRREGCPGCAIDRPAPTAVLTRPPPPSWLESWRCDGARGRGRRSRPSWGVSEVTVARQLRTQGLARVPALEAAPPVQRYERAHPGELLHVDTKPLGRFGRVGHRITGDRRGRARGIGWEYAHVCVDDASRLAYAEILPNEHPGTACGFLRRAVAWLRGAGVTVQRVMSDNGNPYRSHAFAALSTAGPPASAHTPVHAPHEWEGRALHPDAVAPVGLWPGLPHLAPSPRCRDGCTTTMSIDPMRVSGIGPRSAACSPGTTW
jgi:hypothetical protein